MVETAGLYLLYFEICFSGLLFGKDYLVAVFCFFCLVAVCGVFFRGFVVVTVIVFRIMIVLLVMVVVMSMVVSCMGFRFGMFVFVL